MYSTVSTPLSCIEFAIAFGHIPWACLFLFHWLFHHRSLAVRVHRRRRIANLATHLRSWRQIADVFNRWHGGEAYVGKTFVAELKRLRAPEIQALRRERRLRKSFFIPAGHTWALDLTFFQSPHGFTFTVLGIIDAGSRKLRCLQVLPTKCAFALLGHLFLAFRAWPARCHPHRQ